MSDEQELCDVSAAYAAFVDERNGPSLATLFADGGRLVVPDYPHDLRPVVVWSGHDELARVVDGLRRYLVTFHHTSDHRFAIAAERATGTVRCVAHHVGPGDGFGVLDTVWFIRYADEYLRTPGGWRFASRTLHLDFVEQHPVVRVGPGLGD